MEELGPTVKHVRYPWSRRDVMDALASLADREYQERQWIHHTEPNNCDDLTLNIHVLFDDFEILPDPEESLEWILLPGDEIGYLRKLGQVLEVLLEKYVDDPDANYMADDLWEDVMRWARLALAAMVRVGGYEDPDDTADE